MFQAIPAPIWWWTVRPEFPWGGFGAGYYKAWVFPFYTPAGKNVIQAYPFDHPFHNGIFVDANPVFINERQANFWAVPPRRKADDAVFHHVGRMGPGRCAGRSKCFPPE